MPRVTRIARDTVTQVWSRVVARWWQSWQWLSATRDPLTWATLWAKVIQLLPNSYAGRLAVLGVVVFVLLPVLLWYAAEQRDDRGAVTYPHASLINPILGGLGALFLIYAAIRQARTAGDRHEAQTKADLQRRITETFSKAIEQLGSDKLEVRLGGIYALERISQESPQDHWTVMENLTAFVRERTQRAEVERLAKPLEERIRAIAHSLWEKAGKPEGCSDEFWGKAVVEEPFGEPPPADIAAVLTVISRRSEKHRALEIRDNRVLDFRQAVLRHASFIDAHLERAVFYQAHLEDADFIDAHLERAILHSAHLQRANLSGAHLERAILHHAHLEGAILGGHLFLDAERLTQAQIDVAIGDAETELPQGLSRPAHWLGSGSGGAASAE